ncbi:MAG: amino acid adenylation domain-containing protein, partial [Burkholderiales bacterium]
PIGVPGEIHIGGAGLARGYLNRPELTTEKFIRNPFSDDPEARLYKTGDLARYLPDGNIEFLGRIDHQVKIRGFRVELGEIESVLLQHPFVREVAVLAREDEPGDKCLIAYVVCREPTETSALRSFVKDKLPDHMLPSTFVALDKLPLTVNGKVDRRGLPAPDHPRSAESLAAPRTPNEQTLAAIWADVLKLDQVGIGDNFFELGGHSLLATQVISRVRTALNIELPLRALFEAPTVAELSLKTAKICSDKGKRHGPAPITRRRPGDIVPCSLPQLRLWFLDQFEPGTPLYNIRAALRIKGALNVRALKACFNEIVRRHEVLRTTFTTSNEQPIQVVHAPTEFTLAFIDLSRLASREVEAQRLSSEEAHRPFDLSRGPLLRATLLKLDDELHALILVVHHIVSDAWSMGVLYRELTTLYRAFVGRKPSPLAKLRIQYADYALWQRNWLKGEVLDRQIAYWRRQLEGAPSVLELPTDRTRPRAQTYQGAQQTCVFDKRLLDDLVAVSHVHGATLFMTLLAAFAVLLSRYTRSDDIVVGSPIAGRTRAETENLIGFFVNTLVLRTDLSGDPSFAELLARVRETTLGAYAHQDLPLEKVIEALNPERSLSYQTLIQAMFTLKNINSRDLRLCGLDVTRVELAREMSMFDLNVEATQTADGLHLWIEYNTDLFDAATITRLIEHYETLLAGIVKVPNTRLSQLPLLAPAERNLVVFDWNETQARYPQDQSIPTLFEAQAKRTPDAIAVVFEDEELCYADLNKKANRLAYHLAAVGVGPEGVIGVCAGRSLEMIVALLAILKAGGAYLPLDPDYPQERLSFMLEDAQVSVLITERHLEGRFAQLKVKRIYIDDLESAGAGYPDTDPAPHAKPDNLAYVIYTSGSTGAPKGVMIEHGAIAHHAAAMRDYYRLAPNDRVLQFAALSFDVSVEEIFSTLSGGATLILQTQRVPASIADFLSFAQQQSLSVISLPAGYWHAWVDDFKRSTRLPAKLRLLIVGNEKVSPERFALWRQTVGDSVRLINAYGPTEATVTATCYEAGFAPADREAIAVPIGRPIADKKVYILDPHLNPVPVGVPGELHIGGAGLARGYLNRPELTAEKFIANPFSEDPDARLYKTGDLARYLPDGNIEFLGRTDHQIKIRGFRIELGEIEAVLNQHPYVKACAVLSCDDTPGDKRLMAYIVPDENAPPASADLRDFLRRKLPDYMLPSAFIVLDQLPVTPSGKLDRRALPAPDYSGSEQAYVAPRTPTEKTLAAIWAEVLKLDKVGIHDSFFELGGHSLLATQVISRVKKTLDADIQLRALFESPTVAGLSALIVQSQAEALGDDELTQLL